MRRVYLAIPYTGIEDVSFEVANIVAARLMNKGNIVFSPISHSHHIAAEGGLDKGWDYWSKFDRAFIEWCDVVVVVRLDGWEKSKGVSEEIKIGTSLGKGIEYFDP
jgi:hypothetical protein